VTSVLLLQPVRGSLSTVELVEWEEQEVSRPGGFAYWRRRPVARSVAVRQQIKEAWTGLVALCEVEGVVWEVD